jgi:hypothetical protein
MPTELGEPFPITWRGTPEQMLPADVPLWHAYLDRAAGRYKQFYYNVKVGGPDLSKIQVDEGMKKMFYQATAKRIDAIGEKEDSIEIIEVASSPYLRAVGQCLSYAFLWNLDRKINKPAKMVLLCWYLDFDLEMVLTAHQVEVIQLTPKR